MKNALLVVDVGNTATSFGVFSLSSTRPSAPRTAVITSHQILQKAVFDRFITRKIFALTRGMNVRGIMVSSVVPAVDAALRARLHAHFRLPVHFVTAKLKSKIKIHYKNPREVGADRLVNARAAIELAKGASIVIDFGTATTFDCVNARAEYLGGVIAPGPVISAEALYNKTAKLPLVLLDKPAQILGRNTMESIRSGLYHGYRGLVKEIVLQLKKRLGSNTKVFATGGQAHWILKGVSGVDRVVPHLTLLGLYFYWKDFENN